MKKISVRAGVNVCDLTPVQKAKLAMKKIGPQFPWKGRLMWGIVSRAIVDVAEDRGAGGSARRYLRGPMPHAVMCDVNPDWIRSVIGKIGLEIDA